MQQLAEIYFFIVTTSHLQRQHHQSHADHDDDQQLGGPYAGSHVSEAHGGEGDDAEVEGVEQGEVFSCSFQVLNPTRAVKQMTEHSVSNTNSYLISIICYEPVAQKGN